MSSEKKSAIPPAILKLNLSQERLAELEIHWGQIKADYAARLPQLLAENPYRYWRKAK